ncbi:hypothetical protein M9Y10_033132 [Tritrichomonas musculus]|uniref:Uncharacterized protein n=1 Tax=Tritrichomonas musculus TaxID=1915356 RepID=A0ABR2GX58_9EUKA
MTRNDSSESASATANNKSSWISETGNKELKWGANNVSSNWESNTNKGTLWGTVDSQSILEYSNNGLLWPANDQNNSSPLESNENGKSCTTFEKFNKNGST